MKKFLISLILALVITRLPLIDIHTELLGDGGDSYQFMFLMDVAAENMREGRYIFAHNDRVHYPVGFDFSKSSDGALAIILGALFSFVTALPVAYNLTICVICFLNIYLSLLFFEKLKRLIDRKPADNSDLEIVVLVASMIFALSPFVISRLNGHPSLAFVGGFPVFIYYFFVLLFKLRNKETVLSIEYAGLYAALLLIALGSVHFMLLLFWVGLLSFLYLLLFIEDFRNRLTFHISNFLFNNPKGHIVAVGVFILAFIFFYKGYVEIVFKAAVTLPPSPAPVGLIDILVPNKYLGSVWAYISPSLAFIEAVASIGIVSWVLLIYFLQKKKIRNAFVRNYVLLLLLCFILAATGVLHIPFFKEGSRAVVIVSLITSVLALHLGILRSKKLNYVVLALLLLERLTFTVYASPIPTVFVGNVTKLPGNTLLIIPVTVKNAFSDIIPTFTSKKLYGGYVHHIANSKDHYTYLSESPLAYFTCEFEEISERPKYGEFDPDGSGFWEFLAHNGTKSVVVFKNNYININLSECIEVKDNLQKIKQNLILVESTPIYEIYLIKD